MTTTTSSRLAYKRGDIVLVVFPDSNLRTGKLRPALATIASSEIGRVIGSLAMSDVNTALRHTLNL